MFRLALATAAVVAALPVAAAPAATWSEPELVATPSDPATARFGVPRVVFGPSGTAAAAWTVSALFTDPYERFEPLRTGFATSTPGSSWSGAREEVMDLNGELAVDRAGGVSWIGERQDAEDRDYLTVSIVMRSGRLESGGPLFDRTQTIWPRHAQDLETDTSASGASVAIWTGSFPRPRAVYRYAALRRPGKPFGKPLRLTGSAYPDYAGDAAINDRGDAIVAWAQNGRVYARLARAGRSFGRPIVVAKSGAQYRAWAGIDDHGRALVAWNGGTDKDGTGLMAARQGSRGFRRPFALDPPGGLGIPRIARGGPNELLVTWRRNTKRVGVAAITPARITTQDLDPRDPGGVNLAALPDGTAAIAWGLETSPGQGTTQVSLRAPGGEFGPAETAVDQLGGSVAIDPATRQPVLGLSRDGSAWMIRRR